MEAEEDGVVVVEAGGVGVAIGAGGREEEDVVRADVSEQGKEEAVSWSPKSTRAGSKGEEGGYRWVNFVACIM